MVPPSNRQHVCGHRREDHQRRRMQFFFREPVGERQFFGMREVRVGCPSRAAVVGFVGSGRRSAKPSSPKQLGLVAHREFRCDLSGGERRGRRRRGSSTSSRRLDVDSGGRRGCRRPRDAGIGRSSPGENNRRGAGKCVTAKGTSTGCGRPLGSAADARGARQRLRMRGWRVGALYQRHRDVVTSASPSRQPGQQAPHAVQPDPQNLVTQVDAGVRSPRRAGEGVGVAVTRQNERVGQRIDEHADAGIGGRGRQTERCRLATHEAVVARYRRLGARLTDDGDVAVPDLQQPHPRRCQDRQSRVAP